MTIPFSTKNLIDTSSNLYGRDNIIQQLETLSNRKSCVSIIGLRRFGKTSVLSTLKIVLRTTTTSQVYPILLDFKEVGTVIKGTENVYRYMISVLVAQLFEDNIFKEALQFKKKEINASGDWIDIFEQLTDINAVRIQSLFEEIVLFFSEYLNQTILFLFDEYEYLFKYSFDNPVGFMKLRNFSTKLSNGKVIPFSFFIAGALEWNHLCTLTGSPEMNCIDETRYIKSIEFKDFEKLWNDECNSIENCRDDLRAGARFAYDASGGVPFFGKILGSNWLTNNLRPTYFVLKAYLEDILSSLQREERDILIEIVKNENIIKDSKFSRELTEKGLIKKKDSKYAITIGFLADYISFSNNTSTSNYQTPESFSLTNKIANLIITVNNTHHSKNGSYIFEPVNDDAALLNDLRTQCFSSDLFVDFASSIYKIIFERTKKLVNGRHQVLKRLPHPYARGHNFIDTIDILRHSLGGGHLMQTFHSRPGQMTKSDMLLALTGTKNEPNTGQEFYDLQINILKMFFDELTIINNIVRSMN